MINGKSKFYSIYGACVTILAFFIFLAFIIYEISSASAGITPLQPYFNFYNSPITGNIHHNIYSVTGNTIKPKSKTFNVAFGISDRHN
jgi:hypothetical protein